MILFRVVGKCSWPRPSKARTEARSRGSRRYILVRNSKCLTSDPRRCRSACPSGHGSGSLGADAGPPKGGSRPTVGVGWARLAGPPVRRKYVLIRQPPKVPRGKVHHRETLEWDILSTAVRGVAVQPCQGVKADNQPGVPASSNSTMGHCQFYPEAKTTHTHTIISSLVAARF